MILLKLILVPSFLLLLSVAGKRWGASVAGWLAGLPVVAGPILFFLAMEHGAHFASNAASSALSAVFASVAFSIAYARAASRHAWPAALLAGLLAWGGAALGLSALPASAMLALPLSLLTLWVAPRWFPPARTSLSARSNSASELVLRMLAGATLTVGVTLMAGAVGDRWSGLLAVFPVLGMILAVFSHSTEGSAFAAELLRAMATGLYSFIAFCLTLSLALPLTSLPLAFGAAAFASLLVQVATKRFLNPTKRGPATAAAATTR